MTMNIFDMLDEGLGGLFAMGDGGGLGGYQGGPQQPGFNASANPSAGRGLGTDFGPNTSNYGGDPAGTYTGGQQTMQPPRPPMDIFKYGKPGDVSGFASYGMEAPPIADPTQQIQGLMGMAMSGDPHRAAKEDPFMNPQMGGLMQYLMGMGV